MARITTIHWTNVPAAPYRFAMPIPMPLGQVIDSLLHAEAAHMRAQLQQAAGVRLSRAEASRAWTAILEHKWLLSETLGRDVGLRVAAIDYFENVQHR
jgi:hypothetical protein